MSFPYKNPLNAQLLSAPYSVPRNSVQGTDYSVLGIGGWMEVANLRDLSLTFSGVGLQTLSANTVPINLYIGNGTPFNPSYINLNSDNFSSGRRRIGMVVYVNETGLAYQYQIDNYESLWNAVTGATGTVTSNNYDTQVRGNSDEGRNFIDAWTGSTIEGVSGTTREEARWRIFHGTDTFVTGGTYFSATSTINLYRNDGVTIPISGITATGGSSSNGFTGGTVSGATNFTGGLTANTISATTYVNLPTDIRTTGGTYSNNTFTFTNNTGGTYSVLFNTVTGLTINGNLTTTGNTSLQGVTATTISATTYYNLPKDVFVTGGTYTSGNAIFTNNTGGTFTVSGFNTGGGGGQIFYLNLSQSQNGNRLLSTTGSTSSEQSTGVTINKDVTSTISSFQSQPLNTTLLPGGVWSFYLHSYKQNTNASFNIFVEVYKRTSGGTETLLFATDPTPVTTNSPNPSMQLSDGYFSGTSLSVSDGVVAVVRATNTGNQSHTITLVTEGSTHYSYVVSTIPTQQGLTCDTLSGCSIIQTIQTDVSNKLDKSGGTITGNLIINSGLTATTISATTYYNLPSFTGDYLPLSGGTVSGATNFTNDLKITGINSTSGLTRYLVVDISGNTYHQSGGDMILGSTQTNSGAKTFLDTTFLLRNVANTFNGSFVNTNTANRIYTLPDAAGTIALTSNLSSYVPYTGATANVNIGANSYLGTKLQLGAPTGNSFSNFTVAIKSVTADGLYIEGNGLATRILMQAQGLTGGNGQIELLANTNNNSYLKLGLTFLRESSGFLTVSATNFAPTSTLHVRGASASDTNNAFLVQNSTPSALFSVSNTGTTTVRGISNTVGNTFLVQNLTGTTLFSVTNGGLATFNPASASGDAIEIINNGYIKFPSMRFRGSGVGMIFTDTSYVTFFSISNTLTTSKTPITQGNHSFGNLSIGFGAAYFNMANTYTSILGGYIHGIEVKNTYSPSSSTGIFRDLYIAPVISSGVTDWRGIEVVGSGTSVSTLIKLNNGTTDLFVIKGDSKIGFFGATPVVKQTLGVTTAGATYTSTEQGMLQRVYDAIRTYGLGT